MICDDVVGLAILSDNLIERASVGTNITGVLGMWKVAGYIQKEER